VCENLIVEQELPLSSGFKAELIDNPARSRVSDQCIGNRMKRTGIFKKMLIAVVVLLVISVVLLFTLDLGFLKNTIEQQVRDATGRSFEIDGDLSINLGNELLISSGDLKLGNASWAGENQLVEIQELNVRIDPMSIWKGPLIIRQLDLDGVNVFLTQNENGQSNWVLSKAEPAAPAEELPFLLESFSLKNAEVNFHGPRLDRPIHAVIESLIQRIETDGMIHADLKGSLSGRTVSFKGVAGPNSRLLSGSDFEVKGSGNFGNIAVAGSAVFDNLWLPQRPEFDLNVVGPELSELTEMLGVEGLGTGDLSFTAAGTSDGENLTTRLLGNFGEFRLDITNVQASLQKITGSSVNAQVSGPNFGRLARLVDMEGWPEEAFEMQAQVQRPQQGLQIDTFELSVAGAEVSLSGSIPDFPRAGGSEIKLNVTGSDLAPFQQATGLPSLPAGAFALVGDIGAHKDGTTQVNVRYELPLGDGTLSGTIGGGEGLSGSDLVFSGTGENANELGQVLDITGMAAEAWTSSAGIRISDPEYFELTNGRFGTEGLDIDLEGRIGTVSLQEHTDVHFAVTGDRLFDFQAMVGEETSLPEQAFSISGHATAIPDAWQLDGLSGNTGTTMFEINGTLGQGPSMSGSDLQIEASGTDLGKMFAVPGEARLPDGPFTLSSRVGLSKDRLELKNIQAVAGPLIFKLDANLPWPLDFSEGQFNLQTSGQNITRILPELVGLDLDAEDFEIQADGNWQDGRVSISKGSARIGESAMQAQGTLDLPPNLSATDLTFNISSPDLSRLGTIDGARWGTIPFQLDTAFKGTNTRFTMEQFQAQLGESKVLGTFTVDFEPETPQFNLQFTTNRLNLKPFQVDPVEGGRKDEAEPESDERLIPELIFPLEALSKFEGQFAFTAERVLLKRITLHNNAMTGEVREGALTITEMGTDGFKGRLAANISLTPLPEGGASLQASASSKGLIINLSEQSEEEKEALPAFDVDINLTGHGASLREAAASLQGNIIVNSPGGLVKNKKTESVSGLFLAEIVAAISPSESSKEEINISCFAAVMKANEGVIELDPGIALQSDKLNVYATGKIDLNNENVNVNFRTETRNAAKLSASELISPYVKLSGTLSDPSVALDPKGTLLSGGAAYLTGGLSILAKKALGSLTTSKDPCAEHLEKGAN
jgi:uncharacterized protein involved in outer membrane biogenesis